MSITGTLVGIVVFLMVAVYVRFWTGQILLALHDSNYVYALCGSVVAFGMLFAIAFVLGMPHIMTLTSLLLISPIIAAFIYGDEVL